jgi:hypothetical protein
LTAQGADSEPRSATARICSMSLFSCASGQKFAENDPEKP